MPEDAAPDAAPVADAPAPVADSKAPNFDGPFDPERAARLIENLRGEITTLKAKTKEPAPAKEPKGDEDPRYTELLTRLNAAEKRDQERAAELLRTKIAETTGVPAALLTGGDEDSLKQHAEALMRWADERANTPLRGRPRAQLVPGTGAVGDGEAFDPAKIAAAAHR